MKLAVLLLFLLCAQAAAAETDDTGTWTDPFKLSGWLDTVQSVRTKNPGDGLLTSRARLRLELSADFKMLYGFVSTDVEKNWKITSETGAELHEFWLEHAGKGWDIRLGRQIIIWGKADGVQITDIISPPDYTEAFTRDLDETRLPVDAIKFRLLSDWLNTELIWIPTFRPAVLPAPGNPWAISTVLPDGVTVSSASAIEPGLSFKNSEIGMKLTSFQPGLDLGASFFYTWDDFPANHRSVQQVGSLTKVQLTPRHHRLAVFGLECSRPCSDFVFRSEAAWYLGRYLDTKTIADEPLSRNVVSWLGGIDWTPGNDWNLIAQLTGNHIINYEQRLKDREHSFMSTLNLSKKLLRQTLTLSTMLYYQINSSELYSRLKAEYELTDNFRLALGADMFAGKNGQFGVYKDNSQLWVKAKFSF